MNAELAPGYYLVTAGGSGIGLAIASEIAARGGTPVILDIDISTVRHRPDWKTFEADVTDEDAVAPIIEALVETGSQVHGLVSNAGIAGPTELLEQTAITDWERVLRTNVIGAVVMIKNIAPIMKRQRRGSIVTISSAATKNGFPLRAPYVCSKAALEALTETVAMEMGPWGIRANVILPGIVAGPRVEAIINGQSVRRGIPFEDASREFVARTSMKSMVSPADVAAATTFLLSEESRLISGQKLGVCGNFEGYSSEMIAPLAEGNS